ncbi:MAG: hypothetical protein R2698_11275 [Microthrixaceae bacterium]
MILAVLLFGRKRTSRADDAGGTWLDSGEAVTIPKEIAALPWVRVLRVLGWVAAAGIAAWALWSWSPSGLNAASIAVVWAMVAVSLVVLTGWAGQISLGQFALVGVGAVIAGNLIARWDVDLFVALAAATAGGMIVAALIGGPR